MENLTVVSCSASYSSPKLLIGCNFTSSLKPPLGFPRRTPKILLRRSKMSASSAQSHSPSDNAGEIVVVKHKTNAFASNVKRKDVPPEETTKESPFSTHAEVSEASAPKETRLFDDVLQNGVAPTNGATASEVFQSFGAGKGGAGGSVEVLEKMIEDPTFQKMLYPHLPEEMRNPETFKWVRKNPQYRQQLQDMLNNMSESGEWDERMTETLKNFDPNSPEVKQGFDQLLGLTPEEVISKIMENPDVSMAFQNPRVEAALMDCSENPMNIMKYQNDKEVMDVFNKISQLFPGLTG
ncbi:hypothetical protein Bca101_033450 [Brassica carinata]